MKRMSQWGSEVAAVAGGVVRQNRHLADNATLNKHR